MHVSLNWALIVAGAVLVLIEVILGAAMGFDFVLIGSALLLGGALGLVFGSNAVGFAAAGVLALAYVFLGRKRIRNRLTHTGITSNADALLGKTVRVVETIAIDRPGRDKHEGEEWRAQLAGPIAGTLEPGRNVRINRIDGVTVFVEPMDSVPGGGAS